MSDEKILIVEDEKKISDIVKSYLERDGFKVSVAETGQAALTLIKKDFDLIILDLMLPDIEGETICGSIREFSDVPIIMLTAKSAEEDRIKGLGIGADDYVIKPFSPRELTARVKAHLRRTKKNEKKSLSFNNGLLTIDTVSMEVKKGGDVTPLTSTEFRILLCIAEKPQMVFSRLQLVNAVQGYDFEGYDRVIDAHVKNIRHKIEDNTHNPMFIKTVYGAGYKFIGAPD
ncbi:MAG: DNA-binding response regulator [Nitrospirae bacterium GWC2_46_6]|nr:MAG: DNA-binding response regulator [Nitrospirae bacterium GWC2_46_6]OGW21774.1 MAG: DNA-binding response regulator [Nitrospirae bacterium GWA2_46_11]OGW25038.1 MAG: DNA-binding response regulator [Nitrospirae bacterium GWB2_47_37]HAK88892.1 DNA-binding response regulator [Nitrospiraceae bacterium]HCZ12951.1 DNA-binding response regulator [Nitrospiraceae bacterium]